jgi:hypothetical protein
LQIVTGFIWHSVIHINLAFDTSTKCKIEQTSRERSFFTYQQDFVRLMQV